MAGARLFPTTVDVLTRSLSFAEERHRVIANNIANSDTPFYKARRAPVAEFQKALSKAVDRSRRNPAADFEPRSTRHVEFSPSGVRFDAVEAGGGRAGVLRHDENNVDLEREMHLLAENTLMYRTLTDLLRKQLSMLKAAAAERVQAL